METTSTVFVSALPFECDEGTLREIFQGHGTIHSVEVFADWAGATYEPYAHIKMDNAEAAVESLDGLQIGSTYLRVNLLVKP
jgi:hypothetical protein